MKVKFLTIFLVYIFSLSSFAFDLECKSNVEGLRVSNFIFENFSEILSNDSYAEGVAIRSLDAQQRDSAVVNNDQIELALHNGCDNYFLIRVNKDKYNALISGQKVIIDFELEYNYPSFIDEAGDNEFTYGKTMVGCKLIQ